ncbi:hypothetical protein KDW_36210 [Dictyobacter vulcani]|uniref:Phenylacetic acid degradation protein n=1 Tax=Dictyobacter vulcani TaxID=2607529 RepID=A0A5J4KTS3_9CHLR|nr:hypothetical protein [Dictyobacter vulcani]GER89459.1 hypothetical protein KDW_36210 [Dictyobacter vulcani]
MLEPNALSTAYSTSVDEGEVFEIFQQAGRDPLPRHGGNLRAPDPELAVHYAREFYGRRQESDKIWIIPRRRMVELLADANPAAVAEQAASEVSGTPETFALFAQQQPGRPMLWLHNLEASGLAEAEAAALQLAREHAGVYLRFWLCPLAAIALLDLPDLLKPPLDRSYRRLDGYDIREKLAQARQRVKAEEASH